MKFVGIDFGWMRGASGVALLETDDGATTVTLTDVRALPDTVEVLAWIDEHLGPEESALIAVDAPTVIPAGVKMRQVDKLTHTHFGRQHGGAYPANLERPFAKSTTGFGGALVGRRYQHAAEITAQHPGPSWIALSRRRRHARPMRLLHVMLRVGELKRSIDFYVEALGMRLLRKSDYPDGKFTLAFLGYGPEESNTVLELTHNWDTASYELGGGFGHLAVAAPDIHAACARIRAAGGTITREPGPMKHGKTVIAFATDPDGYKVELIERG